MQILGIFVHQGNVCFQCLRPSVVLATYLTSVRFLSRVSSHMTLKFGWCRKSHSTEGTLMPKFYFLFMKATTPVIAQSYGNRVTTIT